VIYHIWPHYRRAVMEAMDRSTTIDYTFMASDSPYEGIKQVAPSAVKRFVHAPFVEMRHLLWQPKAVTIAAGRQYDAVVYLADQHFLSTWVGAALARLCRKPVLMWSHGWIKQESRTRRRVRNAFHRLANMVLVYSERSKQVGVRSGFPADRITVVFNSLDVAAADTIIQRIQAGHNNGNDPRALFADPGRPLLICTARITAKVRLDLLFDAAARLQSAGRPVNLLLVGDGPERSALEQDAAARGLAVCFYGACYDEAVLGNLIYHADLTVSPGKIGLTAMHSLMYGTPAITHDNFDEQMPEVEAIEPGRTGLLFTQNDPLSLANAIARWLDDARDRPEVRMEARAVIHAKWNPATQAQIIENAVLELLGE
jgi:glycosyltransferase involved in cell wall biosynthesis